MRAHIYQIECLTNLHAGNGDVNYNIIDNQVERDSVTGNPTIHSSGVKGALREFCETNGVSVDIVKQVFGNNKGASTAGEYKFLSANLISRPLRISNGEGDYASTTTNEMLGAYYTFCDQFGIAINKTDLKAESNSITTSMNVKSIESIPCNKVEKDTALEESIGANWAITTASVIRTTELPVLARNALDEKGKSQNLWYEEIVPHKSRFWFTILTPSEENLIDDSICGKIVQFGGNASIGYGLCKIKKVGMSDE